MSKSAAGSKNDVLRIAAGSKDHTTLVKAVSVAGLEDSLANPGPFTVFAPTNAAFDKLPSGVVGSLLDNPDALSNVLYHHVIVGVRKAESLQDGENLTMFNGDSVKVSVKDGKVKLGEANIVASVPASNGIVHVIDGVLVPPEKK